MGLRALRLNSASFALCIVLVALLLCPIWASDFPNDGVYPNGTAEVGPTGPAPTAPVPTKPGSSQPVHDQPGVSDPAPKKGAPTKPGVNDPPPKTGAPTPSKPGVNEPAPKKEAPTKPGVTSPAPKQGGPAKPDPSKPGVTSPAPKQGGPAKPDPSKPGVTDPAPKKGAPTKSDPSKPGASDPASKKPAPTKPGVTNPAPKKAAPTKPDPSKPGLDEPAPIRTGHTKHHHSKHHHSRPGHNNFRHKRPRHRKSRHRHFARSESVDIEAGPIEPDFTQPGASGPVLFERAENPFRASPHSADHSEAHMPAHPGPWKAGEHAASRCEKLSKTFTSSQYDLTMTFSQYWEQGSNPSLELLSQTYPDGLLPRKPSYTKILEGVGPDVDISRDNYGWNAVDSHKTIVSNGPLGGLPAFCRFGTLIKTSHLTEVFTEVWMPLAFNAAVGLAQPNASDYPTNSTPISLNPDGTFAKAPTKIWKIINGNQPGALDPNSPVNQVGGVEGISADGGNSNAQKRMQYTRMRSSKETPQVAASEVKSDDEVDNDLHHKSLRSGHALLGPASQGWNGRLLFTANGGFRGYIPFPTMKQTMSRYGFAVVGTNTGHFGTTGGSTWVNGSQYHETLRDWASRSTHVSRVLAGEVLEAFYGKKSKHIRAYAAGCSDGGKAVMASVQNHPEDFDGVLAGCPGIDFAKMNAAQILFQKRHSLPSSEGSWAPINMTQKIAHQVVLEQCDGLDGVVDGVLSNPRHCEVNFAKEMLCGAPDAKFGGSPSTCLNASQLANLEGTYRATKLDGTKIYPAYPYGWEQQAAALTGSAHKAADWYSLTVMKDKNLGDGRNKKHDDADSLAERSDHAERSPVDTSEVVSSSAEPGEPIDDEGSSPSEKHPHGKKGKKRNWFKELTLDIIEKADREGKVWTATKTDISPALNAGVKLISYHGLSDMTISPYRTAQYYEDVARAVKGKLKHGMKLRDAYRHYEIPGMSHCRNGAGPWHFGGITQEDGGNRPLKFDTRHDMLLNLVAWAEHGHIEEFSVGAHYLSRSTIIPTDPVAPSFAAEAVKAAIGLVQGTTPLDGDKVELAAEADFASDLSFRVIGVGPSDQEAAHKKKLAASTLADPKLPTVFEDHAYGVVNTRKLCPYPLQAKLRREAKWKQETKGKHGWMAFECA